MNYTITEVKNDQDWTDLVFRLNKNTFLHSNEWARFNLKSNKTWKFGLYDSKKELVSVCLLIKIMAKRGHFLLVPHGPQYEDSLNLEEQREIFETWKDFWKSFGKKESCSFVRVQPIVLKDQIIGKDSAQQFFGKNGFRYAPIHAHTELTTLLELSGSEEELLLKMRKTTRQMIRKGEKMIAEGSLVLENPKFITEEMHQVYESTYERGGAVAFSGDYIDWEWKVFSEAGRAVLIAIRHEGKLISWGMVLTCGQRAFYHQGGNILVKNVPGSYLVQWNGIKFARSQGCQTYDFWGVAPENKPAHPWANISLFKRGFGGKDVQLLHAQDLVLDWKYWINWVVEWRRAKKRGFS